MEKTVNFGEMQFNLPKNQSNVIKVIGVGGGGSNAVNHMYNKGTSSVDFVICNTDAQALNSSPVPIKIQLGATLTEGLGAGGDPEIGEKSAVESVQAIESLFGEKTKMVFITAGMGGGTGTGAAPIVAKIAKEKGLLTIAIVTTPFIFEGRKKQKKAEEGIEELRKYVDSIIVINNNKLIDIYGDLGIDSGYSKVDEVLATGAMGISKVITNHYKQNIDFRDANTVLANSGTAIMGSAKAEGDNRAQKAITKALDSPLLNDNRIKGAKNVLLLIAYGSKEITVAEMAEINDYIQSEAQTDVDIFMGFGEELELGDSIEVTIVATGFNEKKQNEISTIESKRIVYNLDDSTPVKKEIITKPIKKTDPFNSSIVSKVPINKEVEREILEVEKIVHQLDDNKPLTLFDIEVNEEKFISKKSIKIDEDEFKETGFLGKNISELLKNLKNESLDLTNIEPVNKIKKEDLESEIIQFQNETFISKREFNENELIPTSEIIKNTNVLYEEAITDEFESTMEDDFIITTKSVDLEVFDVEEIIPIEEENQMTFLFDLPINKSKTAPKTFSEEIHLKATNDVEKIKKIEINEPEIVSKNKIYSLEDYIELEDALNNAKAEKGKLIDKIEEVDPELKFQTKIVSEETVIMAEQTDVIEDLKENVNVHTTGSSPMNTTINQLKMRTDERKIKMKKYNYTFVNKMKQSIDELEKQPAYKRNNVELNENPTSNNLTRTSLETDGDDITFRSNNSFLHDNVD